jgi:hypothetical protein
MGSNPIRGTKYPVVFDGFLQFIQVNAGIISPLDHILFLKTSLHLIIQ